MEILNLSTLECKGYKLLIIISKLEQFSVFGEVHLVTYVAFTDITEQMKTSPPFMDGISTICTPFWIFAIKVLIA